MVELKSNEFWGSKSGTNHKYMGLIFKGKRASTVKFENKGGTGKKGRKARKYANKKLAGRKGWN